MQSDFFPEVGSSSMYEYEDALDESDLELQRICEETERALRSGGHRTRVRTIQVSPPIPIEQKSSVKQQFSSSEHSSIEKIPPIPAPIRRRDPNKSNRKTKSASSSHEGSGEEFRLAPYAYPFDLHPYPILLQLNHNLQIISRQLQEMETTNKLQLRMAFKMMKTLIKVQSQPLFLPTSLLRFLKWTIFICVWPFLARFLYRWYSRRRQDIAKVLIRYL